MEIRATKDQKLAIRRNSHWNTEIKEEWVQWATGDVNKTSLNDLTSEQAEKIIMQQLGRSEKAEFPDKSWTRFDKSNKKHRLILSLLYQCGWTTKNERHGEIPDMNRLAEFLKSDKSPVKKPILKMTNTELEKIIKSLSGVVKHVWK